MKTGDFMVGEAETSDWQKAVEAWGRAGWCCMSVFPALRGQWQEDCEFGTSLN